ncbi:hypothetical protein LTR17_005444 [Elasticomyces elasticus]|nr:hypothetical protein LTR17_005444 [Elasticomyces elasticus]
MAKRKRQGSGAVAASMKTPISQTKAKVADTGTQKSAFLALPPELRKRIYEYTLIQSNEVVVDVHLQVPSLLHVSRQVKKEASGIWYGGNHFRHLITDCNAELMTRFERHCDDLGMEGEAGLAIAEGPN